MKKPQIISIILIFAAVVTIMASVVVYFDNDEDTKSSVSVQSSSEVSQATLYNSETVETSLVTSSAVVSLPSATSTVSVSSIAAVSSKPNSSSKSSAKASVSASPAVTSQAAASSANSTAPSAAVASSSPVLAASSEMVSPMSEVVRLINIERAKEGLAALTEMPDIDKAANIRASEIVISFSHQRPSGEEWYTVFAEVGIAYKGVGENLAAGQTTPAEVVTAWMNSEGHRTNIMNASYTKIGVGYVTGGTYGHYWTQLFAR